MKWFLVGLALAGCAKAGKGNSIIGGITDAGSRTDADDIPAPDASLIDAPAAQITMEQATSGTITLNHSFACISSGVNLENSYYRVFTLADFNVTTTLHVTQVDFGIQTATAGTGQQQPATVKIGTYGGTTGGTTLDLAQVRAVSSVDIQIPNGSGTRMTVPITADIAPGTSMIVELHIPDGSAAGNKFYIGTNGLGEKKPGYTLAPDCSYTSPTAMNKVATDIGVGETDLVLSVTGTR
jgi:hypothetical protein